MSEMLGHVAGALFTGFVVIFVMYNLNNRRMAKLHKYLLYVFIFSVMLFLNSYLPIQILKQVIAVISLIIAAKYMVKLDNISAISSAIFIEFVCVIAETISAALLLIPYNNLNLLEWYNRPEGMIFFNLVISLLILIITKLKISRKLYSGLNELVNNISHKSILLVILMSFIIICVMFYVVYKFYYSNQLAVYITIVVMLILYTLITLVILRTNVNYEKIKSKYTLSVENLKSYEQMLDQYRISNHENKNQLLLVRNLSKDKKVKEYIDKLIDNKEKDDANVYNTLKRIPDSSIRAVIYSKILFMNNKKISYSIKIDRDLSSKDFATIPSNISLDICNILSIFMDNAIDEVDNSKIKQVLIEFAKLSDGRIEVAISNVCDRDIDFNKIYGMGYSTKGGEHGYGLSIVKNTVESSSGVLENKTEKINGIFVQHLYINIK